MKGVRRWFAVEGLNIERFVRNLSEAGIPLAQMKRSGRVIRAQVGEEDIPEIQGVVDQGGWKLTLGKRIGVGRCFDTAGMRRGLLCAMIICAAMLFVAFQLVWHVEVSGAMIYQADIYRFLRENDIHTFMWKRDVDLSRLRDTLEWRYPEVAWVDCGWRGCNLRIELLKGVPEGETVRIDGAGDVVALRSGIVEQIITLAGTSVVQPGDVVQKGQVLIRGIERSGAEENITVMARGIVMARVWDQVSVQMDMTEIVTDYTGREQVTWKISCPWFPLRQTEESGFDVQDVTKKVYALGGVFFPFVLQEEHEREANVFIRTRTMAEMKAETGAAALRALENKAGKHDELVDKWIDYCMIDYEVLCANAYGERIVDIAQPKRNTQ